MGGNSLQLREASLRVRESRWIPTGRTLHLEVLQWTCRTTETEISPFRERRHNSYKGMVARLRATNREMFYLITLYNKTIFPEWGRNYNGHGSLLKESPQQCYSKPRQAPHMTRNLLPDFNSRTAPVIKSLAGCSCLGPCRFAFWVRLLAGWEQWLRVCRPQGWGHCQKGVLQKGRKNSWERLDM